MIRLNSIDHQAAIGDPPSLEEKNQAVHDSTCVLGNMNKEEGKTLSMRLKAMQAIKISAFSCCSSCEEFLIFFWPCGRA